MVSMFGVVKRIHDSLKRFCRNGWCHCEEAMSYALVRVLRVRETLGDGLGRHHFSFADPFNKNTKAYAGSLLTSLERALK